MNLAQEEPHYHDGVDRQDLAKEQQDCHPQGGCGMDRGCLSPPAVLLRIVQGKEEQEEQPKQHDDDPSIKDRRSTWKELMKRMGLGNSPVAPPDAPTAPNAPEPTTTTNQTSAGYVHLNSESNGQQFSSPSTLASPVAATTAANQYWSPLPFLDLPPELQMTFELLAADIEPLPGSSPDKEAATSEDLHNDDVNGGRERSQQHQQQQQQPLRIASLPTAMDLEKEQPLETEATCSQKTLVIGMAMVLSEDDDYSISNSTITTRESVLLELQQQNQQQQHQEEPNPKLPPAASAVDTANYRAALSCSQEGDATAIYAAAKVFKHILKQNILLHLDADKEQPTNPDGKQQNKLALKTGPSRRNPSGFTSYYKDLLRKVAEDDDDRNHHHYQNTFGNNQDGHPHADDSRITTTTTNGTADVGKPVAVREMVVGRRTSGTSSIQSRRHSSGGTVEAVACDDHDSHARRRDDQLEQRAKSCTAEPPLPEFQMWSAQDKIGREFATLTAGPAEEKTRNRRPSLRPFRPCHGSAMADKNANMCVSLAQMLRDNADTDEATVFSLSPRRIDALSLALALEEEEMERQQREEAASMELARKLMEEDWHAG